MNGVNPCIWSVTNEQPDARRRDCAGSGGNGGGGIMDTLTVEHLGRGLFKVSYNGVCVDVPWFKIDSAVKRVVRHYHAMWGVGR